MSGFLAQLAAGTLVTLALALTAASIGLILGFLCGLVLFLSSSWPRILMANIVFIIRGLPEILILFFIYFGLSALLSRLNHHYVELSPFVAGASALSIIFAAYAAQVFKGALSAIDHGQLEAGKALGLSEWQLFWRIQFPQVWRHALPALGNLWLVLLKDTAIVMLIGLMDLMSQAKIATSATHQPFIFYLLAALIYLMITWISQCFLKWLIRRTSKYISCTI